MDYDKAEQIRKKSFGSLLGEQEGGLGASLKSAISQKTQAKVTGIKEKFDPMNIARAVGGKTGAAVYGKVFGRDQKSMERFAGARKKRVSAVDDIGKVSGDSSPADVLGLIYRMMLRNAEDEKLQNELKQNKREEEDKEEEDRNQQLIRALTGRKKPPTKKEKEKAKEKKPEEEKPTEPPKPTVPKGKGKGKAPTKAPEKPAAKEAPKAPTKAPEKPAAKEAPKAPTKAPEVKPKVEKAPEVPKPEVKAPPPAPKPTVKPPAEKIKPPVMTGGDKGIMNMIKQHEGAIPYPYKDSKGLWTIGVGHLIGDGKSLPSEYEAYKNNGGPYDKKNNKTPVLTEAEMEALFIKDFESHKKKAMKAPGWNNANETGQAALIDLTYNMGAWWTIFKKASAAMEQGDFNRAADQLQYKDPETKELSLWYQQVKGRAVKIVDMVRQGGKSTQKSEPTEIPKSTGQSIDSSSKENKDLKNTKNDKSAPTVINNNTNTQQNSTNKPKRQEEDDRSAYQKKAQG